MALGSYDANGIWNFGESDNIAPFSTTLNKLATSTSSAITADRARIATLESGSLSGLIPIKPTSVTISGGTATVNDLGVVSWGSGTTTVTLNNVFSANYRNYRFIHRGNPNTDSNNEVRLRFANGGIPFTTDGWYCGLTGIDYNGTSRNFPVGNGSSGIIGVQTQIAIGDIFNPFESGYNTWGTIQNIARISGVGNCFQSGSYSTTTSRSYDGITIFLSAGSYNSGSLQVFGYND